MASILCLFGRYPPRLYCIDLGSLRDVAEIEHPRGWGWVRLLGSCRRVLCISNWDGRQVAIWNPATGSCRLLPPANAEIAHGLGLSGEIPHIVDPSASVYGFGYDDRNNEYVLLRVVQTLEEPIISAVSIYRSRANAWRRLQRMPYYLHSALTMGDFPPTGIFLPMGVFLRGRLHWIMKREPTWNSAKVLVAFDIRIEGFVEVDLPNFIGNRLSMNLADLGGCLCLTIFGVGRLVDAWIMREYGLNGPWDMLFSIRDRWCAWGPVQPLAYYQNGRRVLVRRDGGTLVWYNLQTRGVEEFRMNGMPNSFAAATCL